MAPGGVPREVLRQVRLIELRTRGWVNTLFSGEYHSVFKGQGMEFAEVREYQPGDDVRTIDWNVTARMGHPYVKKHVEERELTVMLLVDLSGSEQFGTRGRLKAELAAELAAVLALSAIRNNDRVGLLIFTDHVEHVVPPKKGRRHVLRLIRDLLAFRPRGRGTDIASALDYAGRMLPHRSILFVLSDFLIPDTAEVGAGTARGSGDPAPGTGGGGGDREAGVEAGPGDGSGDGRGEGRRDGDPGPAGPGSAFDAFSRTLKLVSNRHDVVAIRMVDAAEEALPDAGLLVLTDPETGQEVAVDTGRASLRERYGSRSGAEEDALRSLFRRLAVDEIEVRTDGSYVGPLMQFFKARERRAR
ncbi:MAG: DUF58 domain-containing protein [Gemmatimonadetes bacterium]|nr:DUF58 domain-containing protein [Gemmatimonadota bacterium]NIQ55272.1 DUF58 domain-containing protein [Gemmatimonadota bacterium]NIU75473.1 DUF58 domain-containing protein [Gammaproteobacteria bacterium]NIX45201.1 DUF58 domain-containing protein [Gemmatimonadota bacterium]NIY09457.1 DUF58 domain-containing protein [Gemmatimonadota bacterium]